MGLYKKTIFYSLIVLAILAIVYFIYTRSPLFADTLRGQNGAQSQDNFYIKQSGDRFATRFSLIQRPKNIKDSTFELDRYSLFGGAKKIELPGFEQLASLQDHYNYQGSDYLFFSGDVGAHSRNLAVVKVTSGGMAIISFKNESIEVSSSSDLPRFEIASSQSSLDILVYNRDYDLDPIKNYLVDRYELKDNRFDFVSETKALATGENQPDSPLGGIK